MSPINLVELDEAALRRKVVALRKEDPQDAKVALEHASSYLAELSQSLKALWNDSVVPIHSLPEELLAHILTEAVEMDSAMENTNISWRRRVEVSRVCKTWRAAALNYPTYWAGTRLHLSCRGLMKMLPRWKGHPRRVGLDLDAHKFTSVLQTPRHFDDLFVPDRIADFRAFASSPDAYFVLWIVLPKGWNSMIHTLHISCLEPVPRRPTVTVLGPDSISVPAHILLDTNGALRHLTLEYCVVDWKAFKQWDTTQFDTVFRELRTLKLSSLSPPPPSAVLNHILSSIPHVKNLEITDSFPEDFDPTFRFPKHSPVGILWLSGPLGTLAKTLLWMLSTSTFDDLRCLRFYATNSRLSDPPPPTEPLLPLASQVCNRFCTFMNGSQRGKTLAISQQDGYFLFELEGSDVVDEDNYDTDTSGLSIDSIPHHFSSQQFPLLEACNVPDLEALRLQITPELSADQHKEAWDRFFQRHPKLEALELMELHRWDVERIKDFLYLLTPLYNGGGILLPKLRKLRVMRTEIGIDNFIMNHLEVMMLNRWDNGFPIAAVEFDGCGPLDHYFSMMMPRIPADVTHLIQLDKPTPRNGTKG